LQCLTNKIKIFIALKRGGKTMMYYKYFLLLVVGVLLLAVSIVAAAPAIFYSDLENGPNTGGENDKGAYVTIYGKGFGATKGTSTVTVGGGAVAGTPIWSDTKITLQLGAAAVTGNIVVNTAGENSNGLPFTIRPGSIFFVDVAGNNLNDGSFAAPWKTLNYAVIEAKKHTGPIIYARDGVSATTLHQEKACLFISSGGTASVYNALIAYPGATVTIGDATGGVAQGIRTGKNKMYWVFCRIKYPEQ
jgi:hypothetical protein